MAMITFLVVLQKLLLIIAVTKVLHVLTNQVRVSVSAWINTAGTNKNK